MELWTAQQPDLQQALNKCTQYTLATENPLVLSIEEKQKSHNSLIFFQTKGKPRN